MSRYDSGSFLPSVSSFGNHQSQSVRLDRHDRRWPAHEDRRSKKARKTRNDLKIGICGEHGGDPSSVMFCHSIGLNYVSCSPFRVPIARLAAAQAALRDVK